MLDTDTISLLQHDHKGVVAQLEQRKSDEIATTIITVEEQLSAWYTLLRRAKDAQSLVPVYQRMTITVEFLRRLPIRTFTLEAAQHYERLRSQSPRRGRMDLRIAAIALAHDATLATRNLVDFDGIVGLPLEDWSSDGKWLCHVES